MAATAPKPISNIAIAFAHHSASVDIPNLRDARHPSTIAPNNPHDMLPTPPNSISPTLPPHKVRSCRGTSHNPQQSPDSDVEVLNAAEHAAIRSRPQALSTAALSGLEAAQAITPLMLAENHLPDILLSSGPMAIRHVLHHLTQTVPGFSRIPPAKARRIVVSALESRVGPLTKGTVLFEKVGWGRWDARIRGQPPRDARMAQPTSGSLHDGSHLAASPPPSLPGSYALSNVGSGLQIPSVLHHFDGRRDIYSGGSWTGESAISSHDEDMDMAEHEADKMSLDGQEDDDMSSHAAPEDEPISDNPDDVTDEEDWANIGPQALRQGFSAARTGARIDYNSLSYSSSSRIKIAPFVSGLMKSGPGPIRRASSYSAASHRGTSYPGGTVPPASSLGVGSTGLSKADIDVDSQERDAIEALLSMGSSGSGNFTDGRIPSDETSLPLLSV
ncbi:hypothetical protein FKW77_000980 [Venturia effusa]|uniref:Sin3 binding protein n=1 Tax=Venturia effusa TaxID=50376 RepID=A0A517LD61_9PEZI|nr:hypothetical protein FKW77_000980 [Venturia effusa]